MWRYFVEATTEIIEQEGIDQVTARKVADRAGFTSSTVYNYFQELSHLTFFSAMRFTKSYIEDLPHYMNRGTNTIEKWLYGWVCFCKHSFKNPKIYSVLFINHLGSIPEDLLEHYYQTYRHDMVGLPEQVQSIILEHQLSKRSALYLQQAVDEGLIETEDIDLISQTTLLMWKGMMTVVLNHRRNYTPQEAMQQTMHYIYESVLKVIPPDRRDEIHISMD